VQGHPLERCVFDVERLDLEWRVVAHLFENPDAICPVSSEYQIEFFSPRYDIACEMTLGKNESGNSLPDVPFECRRLLRV